MGETVTDSSMRMWQLPDSTEYNVIDSNLNSMNVGGRE